MPTYVVRDPQTGRSVKLTGDSPPTEAELTQVFASLGSAPQPMPSAASAGMLRQSTASGDPASFTGRSVPPEIEAMNGQEMMGTSPFIPNPLSYISRGAAALARSASPTLARVATIAANHPRTTAAAVGAAPGVVALNPQAALTGAILGAMGAKKPTARAPRAPKAPAASAPAAAAPVASPPAAPAPAAAPSAPPAAATGPAGLSPQMVRNQVGLAARRSGLKLSDEQMEAADRLVMTQGVSPLDAVKTVGAGAPPVAPAKALPPTPTRLKLNAAEGKEYVRMRGLGKTHNEAAQAIADQRAFAAKFGTPSDREMNTRRDNRKTPARWPAGTNR